jgi:5-(carboxyamino)imidazole ribonucleotide synthase
MTLQERKIGIIGSGQLGKMLLEEAVKWDLNTSVLSNEENAPCKILCKEYVVCKSYFDYESVYNFGKSCHTLTIEIEHINVDALEQLEKEGVKVYPQPGVLRVIQNKGLQKEFYDSNGILTAAFSIFKNKEEIINAVSASKLILPFVQKLCTGGYDGKGVAVINSQSDLDFLMDGESVIEEKINIDKEFAVIVARNANGESVVYDAVEMVFNDEANLLDILIYPARISEEEGKYMKALAIEVSDAFKHVGLLAVEMLLDKEGRFYVNEVAPLPHISGHNTIEASICSQFEQHLRAILNLPLGSPNVLQHAVMVNLVGEKGFTGNVWYDGFEKIAAIEGVYVHLYGKLTTKPFRKMGHITICSNSIETAIQNSERVKKQISVKAIS